MVFLTKLANLCPHFQEVIRRRHSPDTVQHIDSTDTPQLDFGNEQGTSGADSLATTNIDTRPLAERMRPVSLTEYIGQQHLLGADKPLRRALEQGSIHSMILWGPPGTGKTTLARLLAQLIDAEMVSLSAVLDGVKEVRSVAQAARERLEHLNRRTLLFVDEVHRFNKAQQDAFLPFIEDGSLTFVGATTENPSFALNGALLSRARTYVLQSLTADDLVELLKRTLVDCKRGLGTRELVVSDQQLQQLAGAADGDARRALNYLEIAADLANEHGQLAELDTVLAGGSTRRFDNHGDIFYEQISALHKSIRGSSADGALYWISRMFDGGADPRYIARRLIRMASEDIGNADPRALTIASDAAQAYERLGSPEGELALAQAAVFLACAPKSNAVYTAFNQAMVLAEKSGSLEVPDHLRNAPTGLMKDLGYGQNYRYAHDEPDAYAAGVSYLPPELENIELYQPVPRGLEIKIAEKLKRLKALDAAARETRSTNKKGQPNNY